VPLAAAIALLMTLSLTVARPKIGRFGRLNPALGAVPGLALLFATGLLGRREVDEAARDLWRPLVTVSSVMTTTFVAHKMGIFDRVTRSIEIRTRGAVPRAYTTVFVIAVGTATVFNNDAAILLLTPIILPVIRRLYPLRPYLVEPFAFAVFMAAGVAPLSTSNPMNLVVAERAGVGFNAYALRMIPVSAVAAAVSYAMLRAGFRAKLEDSVPARGPEQGSLVDMEASSRGVLGIVIAMFLAYPVLSYFDGPVWLAAAVGATLIAVVGVARGALRPRELLEGVAWDILAFLFFVFLTAMGLRNVGLVDLLGRVYALAGGSTIARVFVVGVVSAIGSAVLNNHPMAALNSLALQSLPGEARWPTLAALVGGDLGPRLLPMGSLAGLLWIATARRVGLEISTRTFIRIGVACTIPALAASLATLCVEYLVAGR
jgi:arsenical pump membrane protein